MFFIPMRISGYVTEVRLNGAPMLGSPQGYKRNVVQVNQWIIHGDNVLEVRVTAEGPTALAGEPRTLDVALGEGDPENIPGEEPYRRWAVIPPLQPGSLPQTLRATCRLEPPFPRWRWQDAEPVTLDAETRRGVTDYVVKLYQIVERRDLDQLEAEVALALSEVMPVYGTPFPEARDQFRRAYAGIFARADFALAPLRPEEGVWRQACGGRLVTVETPTGASPVRALTYDAQGGWAVPFWLGRLDRRWQQLR